MLVKRLVTIEDLGNIEVLFTDKTCGTLTEGAITFDQALDPAGPPATAPLLFGLLANEGGHHRRRSGGGNALDAASWSAPQARHARQAAQGPAAYQRLGLIPFDHERQIVSVLVRSAGDTLLLSKGAPEAVLARCVDPPALAHDTLDRLFADGARVVAVGSRSRPPMPS